MSDRTQAFTGLTDDYRAFRPGYPGQTLETLRGHVREGATDAWPEPWLLLDVGAGTGISTRALRAAFGPGPRVVGVEPGHDMRDTAEAGADGADGVEYVDARAEGVPFPDSGAALVLTAQALHWFDRPAFYAESVRLLAPGGTLAVLNNNRDLAGSAFIDEHESFLEWYSPGYDRHYRTYDLVGELSAVRGLTGAEEHSLPWARALTPDEYLGMAMSSSRTAAAARKIGEDRTRAELRAIADRHFPDGRVEVPYTTQLVLARRV
ncbi:methyltransferase [Nocardiopsis terrae]|uniref:SAM-dependent methyltransferase n=1 Tax=Nocardiopsis terrae TaxID=372655 RepID=A0ABR9HCR4_9ACTN|nr:class I SAM-dependent methyltransferase [Nocardiopsis terrae]MBE1456820.1 SAM-dependent methyltransferase [Nocardiopsis terrae]GHC74948.1 methyltransferase [Nocardiopsis terrae]